MLRIFDRYIGRQILVSTVFAVGVLSVVMVLQNIFKRLLNLPAEMWRDLPPVFLVKFIGYALVSSLSYTVPWSLLTAVLLVFGRMSADNELLAIRMAGRSMTRICAPIFVLAFACSAMCFWINVHVAPVATAQMKGLVSRVAADNPLSLFTPDRVIDEVDDFMIYFGKRKGDELSDFQMIMLKGGKPTGYVSSRLVKVTRKPEEEGLELTLTGTQQEISMGTDAEEDADARHLRVKADPYAEYRKIQPVSMSDLPQVISLKRIYDKARQKNPPMMDTAELRAHIADLDEQARHYKAPTGKKKSDLPTPAQEASSSRVELHKRFSFSLAGIVFALIGVPLAITAQRRETSMGFLFSLIIGISYLLFFLLGDVLKDNPRAMPHLIVWFPNLLFLTIGGIMFARLNRK